MEYLPIILSLVSKLIVLGVVFYCLYRVVGFEKKLRAVKLELANRRKDGSDLP
jgi:hypothetical protein